MRNSSEIVAMRKLASSKIFRVRFLFLDIGVKSTYVERMDLKGLNNKIKEYYDIQWQEVNEFERKYGGNISDSYGRKPVEYNIFETHPKPLVVRAEFMESLTLRSSNAHKRFPMGFHIYADRLDTSSLKQILNLGLKYNSWEDYERIEHP